jgi:hypothetical protein
MTHFDPVLRWFPLSRGWGYNFIARKGDGIANLALEQLHRIYLQFC